MGAALHLAHVQQAPAKKRQPKRTGGGNGSRFAEIAHRIYQDDRADTQTRQLLLATAYAITMAELDEETSVWRAICNAIGPSITDWDGLRGQIRHGLMPSYFNSDWVEMYRWATRNPTWEPPKVYGLRADDWPVPGKDPIAVPQRARLRLVVSIGDLEGGE